MCNSRPQRFVYLIMCEVSHQPMLNVGVVGNMTQDFGRLKGSFRVGIAVVQIPARDTGYHEAILLNKWKQYNASRVWKQKGLKNQKANTKLWRLHTYLAILTIWSAFLVWGLTPWRSCSSGETSIEAWLSLRRSMNITSFCRARSRRRRQCSTAISKCCLPVKCQVSITGIIKKTFRFRKKHALPVLDWERCSLTREWRICVQLANTFLQQAETERQHGRIVKQVKHDAVSGGLVGWHLLTLQFHHLLDKVRRLRLIVPQQFVEDFQNSISNLPLYQKQPTHTHKKKTLDKHSFQRAHIPFSFTFSAGRRYALVGKGRNTESRKKSK